MNNFQTASVEDQMQMTAEGSSLCIGDYIKNLKFKEKMMRSSVNKAGLVVIFSMILMLISSFFVVFPLRYAYMNGLMTINEIEIVENWINVLLSVLIIIPPVLFYVFNKENKVNNFIKVEKGNFIFKLCMVFFGVAAGRLANIPAFFLDYFLEGVGLDPGSQSLPMNSDIEILIPYILSVVIMAPLLEEFVYRGVILSSLQKYGGDTFAVVISGLIFGMMHGGGGISAVVAASMSGILMGFIYVKTRNIWVNIAVHLIYNASAVTSNLAYQFLDEYLATEISEIMVSLIFVLGFVALILLVSVFRKHFFTQPTEKNVVPVVDRFRSQYTVNRYDALLQTPATPKQIIKSCFTSVSFWILLFYVVFNLVANNS